MLKGNDFLSILGSRLPGLEFPLAVLFALVSAFSFGGKLVWPGTHSNLRSITPWELAISGFVEHLALWNSSTFCCLSCLSWSFSIAVCI